MSHLRAPAARADRREGGRHGKPVARSVPALPEAHIRPQLLRLAVLPPVAVALSGSAAVLFTVRSTGARTSPTLWAVLAGALSVTVAGVVIAAVAAGRAAGSVGDRVAALRGAAARGEADLRSLVETLRRGESVPPRKPRGGPPADADDFELLAADIARAHEGAVSAVVQATQLSSQTGSEQKLEVFVNLARRLQSLVHREISLLDELESEIEDPDLLKGLFHVDHLATRIRRHAENLAVLGGAVSRRQWSNPVSMTEVLRSAIAEVEQYSRVKLVPPIDGELRGHAVADVIHLLAELVENATVFSAPQTQVMLRANLVTSGLAVEVEDRGLGMPVPEQKKMNALLADPDQVNVASLLSDGRIGLYVVSQLARRHGIHVRLQSNIYGGVQAVLVVPQALLGGQPPLPGGMDRPRETTGAGDTAATAGMPGPAGAAGPARTGGTAGTGPVPVVPVPGPRTEGTPAAGDRAGSPHSRATGQGTAPRPSGGAGQASAGPGDASDEGGFARSADAPAGAGFAVGDDAPGGNGFAVSGAREGAGFAASGDGSDGAGFRACGGGTDGGGFPVGGDASNGRGLALSGSTATAAAPSGGVADGTVDGGVAHGRAADGGWAADCGRDDGGTTVRGRDDGGTTVRSAPVAGGPPAPLPVRGGRRTRPTPAAAVPGIKPDERPAAAEDAAALLARRVGGPVRGTMGRPRLPRRRAQEHIVPQLRGGPAPRQENDTGVGHDPGLMAAFQRGVGLAEAQQRLDPAPSEPTLPRPAPAPEAHAHSPGYDGAGHDGAVRPDRGTPTG